MKKRVLSMLMTLALCLTLFPAPAWATEDAPEGGAIVQQEQQEEISPAVSEQAGTNEEENGSEGDPQNTGTPDAGGAEDSKADAPESGEDENAGNNADAAVSAVQTMIDALPIVSELDGMTAGELDAAYDDIQAAYDAYEALNAEQQAQITGADFEALLGWFNSQTAPLADAQSGVHTHCVCGGNGDVNGHEHDTAGTEWTTTDSLPDSVGNYYLTKSVSENWTVPTDGEVNLCLNGQTINGKITVGSGATLTLTDCSDSGRVQGEVTVNGGKLELYSGTITGGVQVGKKGADYQTGSSFTMYGGAITGNEDYGGVFLVGTTNHTDPPSFTMHGGTISDNTAGASDGGGGGVYVGEKCSFTMDGGAITGNTATAGNGGGIYIHFNAGTVSISNATITGNKASATGNTSYGHGGGIYSERSVTVKDVTITGNNSTYEGGGIYGNGTIALTDATVTDNNQYDVYYDGTESTNPKLTVSGSVKAGYYANYDWKLPILVSGALSEDSVIRVGVREGINPGAIAEPASGVTLRAENFKADAADCVTSLGDDGKVYLVPCTHEMDDTGYTCKKCKTQFDARVGDSAYYKTLTDAFNAARGSTVTLLRNVTLTGNCSSDTYPATLDLNGKTVSSGRYYIHVGGGNKPNTLTVKDSSKGGGTQALNVKFWVASNGTLAVDDSYTGDISCVELQAGGALERFGGEIGELVLSNAAAGSTSTGYNLKLWNGNTNACTIGKITDNTKSKSLTVNDLLGTDYAKCELYGEKGGAWSIVPKTEKISGLTGYTAYKVQFPECVHQCADDSNPVCSVCHKELYTKITAKAADGTTKTAYFTEDSALENGYVEAIQTLNGWSNEGCTEPTLTLLRDMPYGTSITLTGTLTLESGTHTAKNVTVAEGADVTFASGSYKGATIDGTATVKEGVTFTSTVTVNGTLNAKGGTFDGPVEFNGSSTANISGGSFNNEKKYGGVEFDYNVTGTISGGTFVFADFYTTKVKLSGGTFTMIKTNGERKLADLLAEGAAYYNGDSAVSNDNVASLTNVTVKSHEHNGGTDGNGTCSICGKKMAASLTVGGKTSWYTAFASAIEAANAADGEKTITLYQDVNGYADGHSTTYELTHGPVTLATGGKTVTRVYLIAKGISLTVTGSNGDFNVTVDGKDAELTVDDGNTELAIVTAKNGGKLSLSNGTFSRVAVKDDGSSASLSGGSYGEITSDTGYVKPYALLAKGYAYKRTRDNQWLPNANSISEKVTVEKAPFAVEKIYPNSDTNYTGNSAFATDGNITLTAVIASEPETENVTYYYRWEVFNESKNDWTTSFKNVNTATHTGGQNKTLSISNLPENSIYQYRFNVWSSNGYDCYSEPFTVTRHQHSWTYTASGATITAKCTAEGCYLTDGNGGSVTIAAPAELTYSGEGKPATVTASSDWQGPAASEITISYIKTGKYGPEKLENDALPTKAGEYTASITLDNATASVKYTIQKANPVVTEWPTLSAPVYVNSEATLTGGSGEGTFAFKADAAKSWDSAGSKTTTIVFTPTDTNNYNELTKDYPVTVVKRTVKNCNMLTDITDKPCGTAQEELGLPGTVTITTEDGKTFEIPVAWNGYDPDTLKEQTLTGTLDLTSIADEVEQPSTPVTAQIKVKLTQKNFSGISPEAYDGVYDGKAHGITLTGVPSGATVKYGESAESCTQDSLTYTNFTNGPKFVYYKVSQSGYADASGSATVNITKRPLTVTGITANDKAYDGNTKAVLDYSKVVLNGILENDTLTVTATGTMESAGVGEQKVTISGLTLGGASAANYVLAESGNQAETTATITAKEVNVTITPNGGTYGSVVAAAAELTGAVDGENVPVTLTYTGNGYNDTAVPVNAGSYTVTASIANSNYTLTGNTTADFVITPKAVTVTGITAKDKVYDGTTNADISSVTFDGVTLNLGTDYTVTANFDDAGVGNGKNITATVTLMGQTAKNYALEQSSFPTTGSITKATAPDFANETTLAIINNYEKTYTVTLPALPTLETPKEYGAPTYELGEIKLNDGYYTSGAKVENGKLTLPIQKNDVGTTGSVGTVTVVIKSTNYEDITLTVKVNAENKIEPTPDGEITATPITYGDTLSKSKISGKMKDPDTGIEVKGTFAWPYPDDKPNQTGDYKISWIFTPDESYGGIYAAVTDPVKVHVAPKSIGGATITLKADSLKYNAKEQSPKITRVTLDNWDETGITYIIKSGDKATDVSDSITLTIEGTGNYTGTATAKWKIIPAELTVSVPSVTKEYDGTTNATVTPTFNGLQGKDTLTAADYSVTAAFDNAKVGYKKTVIGKVTLNQTDTANNYLLNDGNINTDNGTIAKAAAPTVPPVELTIYNGVQKDYFVDLPPLPELGKGKSYGTVGYRKPRRINLSEGYIAQSELGADHENLNTLRLLLRMKQTGSLTGEIGTVTIPVTTSNYQDINLTVNVSAVNQIKPVQVGTITATPITYGDALSASTITGTMQDPATGDAVNGTFAWTDGTIKPDANDSYVAEWIFTPDASYGGKYTTNNGTATVTVNRKTVTVSGITANDKVYDSTTNAKLNFSNAKFAGILENDTLTVTAKGVFEKADIGKQKVTISDLTLGGASAANYVLAESGNQSETTATITAKEVTVTITPKGGTYGSVVAAAAKLTGAVDGDNVPVTLTYTGNNYSSATLPVNVGSYTVTASIANSNYTLTGKTTANFVIAPKAVTVTGITAKDKVYDGTTNATLDCSNAQFEGILQNDKLTVTAKGMFETAVAGKQNVAISGLTLGGASAANYVLAGSGNQTQTTATITAKKITVSITPNGGIYGETITPATATANGVVGEDAPGITLTYTGTANDGTKYTGTTPPTKAGTYTIKASTTDKNYTLDANTATAKFTVAKRGATVTPDNKSKVYKEKDPDLTYKVDGVLDGETLKGITLTRAEGENAGEYAIIATADVSANPNYDVTFAEGTFTIEPKSIKGATVVLGKGLAANGAEQTQTVEKVLLGDKEIPADSYTVTGNTATAHGIYTLTITAKGNYTDSIAWTYVIAPSKAEDAPGEEITIGSGKVKVDVKSEGAVPSVGLLTDKAELLAMLVNSGDITADELAQIADGASVDIALTVKEANVSAEIKTAMAQAAKGCTIGQYLDISLFKYMTVNGKQQDGVALHTTKNALPISVVVPDALINTNSAVNRNYCIVRNHEGTITVLDAAFDAANKTLTFKTDRFSVYAIAYKDTAVPSSGSNPGSNNSSNDSETKKNEVAPTPAPTPASTSKPSTITAMPQTGDTSNPTLYVVLLVVSLLGLAVIFVCKRRNNK